MKDLSKEEIAELFMSGVDCSQLVLADRAEELGISQEEAYRISSAFGGGMGIGESCGAVIGAMIALGIKYGNTAANQPEKKTVLNQKRAEFIKKFTKIHSSCSCKELLGLDFSKPEDVPKIFEKNLLFDFCPDVVQDAINILREMEESVSE